MSSQTDDAMSAAYGTMYADVHAPAFFQKLAADHNFVPANDEQAEQLLQMGEKLFDAQQRSQTKAAAANTDFFAVANSRLDTLLGNPTPADNATKQAAASLSQSAAIRQAALTFQNGLLSQAADAAAV
jgi:hypothetical protein